jgi:hypothetical protein
MRGAGGWRRVAGCLGPIVAIMLTGMAQPQEKDDPDDGSFGFTKPVACVEINGFDDYVELSGAALTSDEKLIVYFRPRHFKTTRVGRQYEAHFTEDVRVRRRGQKPVLWSKLKMVDYQPKADIPRPPIYFHNKIALKGLMPGLYELEIVLRDEVGQTPPAVRVLPFEVILPKDEPKGKKAEVEEVPDK